MVAEVKEGLDLVVQSEWVFSDRWELQSLQVLDDSTNILEACTSGTLHEETARGKGLGQQTEHSYLVENNGP